MSPLDWGVLAATLAVFVGYGIWRGRGTRNLDGYLAAGRTMPWPMVALSVMATQASAVTFLATPGQGYAGGLSFVQFYFGLPLAMVVLCVTAVPIYHRLKVYTAYEYLENRFDAKTRTLASVLFLVQRGLAAGITLYAPALVLSVLLGWDLRLTCALLGALVVLGTTTGGSRAVSHSQALQFAIILGAMAAAFAIVWRSLPHGVTFGDAMTIAGHAGRLNAVDARFDLQSRYNLWSGLIGGLFLQLSYFGTDQSQVGRFLTGASVRQTRLGLLINGMLKVPMQFAILLLGVLVFVFYQFNPPPVFFNPAEVAHVRAGPAAPEWQTTSRRHANAALERAAAARTFVAARHGTGDPRAAGEALARADANVRVVRDSAVALVRASHPGANPNDTNYVFLTFVLAALPAGLIGLVLAAMFAAAMNSISAELNALASTTIVDVVRRLPFGRRDERTLVLWSRGATLFWAAFAIAFAENASRLGTLVEAVNILGSLFYGVILGIFLTAFFARRVGGTPVFAAAILAELAVIACFRLTSISFLWYNVVGALLTIGLALAFSRLPGANAKGAAAAS